MAAWWKILPSAILVTSCAASALALNPAPPTRTIWNFLGIPQATNKLRDGTANRTGNRPGLERKPPLKALADPANLESQNPAIKAAAQIKQEEDLAKQKIKAIKYLAEIGCGCYPGVKEALMAALDDCTEDVRLAAAEAIGEAAQNKCKCGGSGACGSNCCCDEEMSAKLAERAYDRDDKGCYLEPSEDVRDALKVALRACCPNCGPAGPSTKQGNGVIEQPPVERPPTPAPPETPPDAPPSPPSLPMGTGASYHRTTGAGQAQVHAAPATTPLAVNSTTTTLKLRVDGGSAPLSSSTDFAPPPAPTFDAGTLPADRTTLAIRRANAEVVQASAQTSSTGRSPSPVVGLAQPFGHADHTIELTQPAPVPHVDDTLVASPKSTPPAARERTLKGRIVMVDSDAVRMSFDGGQPQVGALVKVYHTFALGEECVGVLEVTQVQGNILIGHPVGNSTVIKMSKDDGVLYKSAAVNAAPPAPAATQAAPPSSSTKNSTAGEVRIQG